MYIANNNLQYINKNKKKIFKKINSLTSHFEEKLNVFFKKNKLDLQVIKFKSMARIIFSSKIVKNRYQRDFLEINKNIKIDEFKSKLLHNKIFYPGNGTIFFNFAMNLKDINYLIKVIQTCSKDIFDEKK